MRGAPFLGWILVRGMWCADFGADFGARCVVFGLDFGARCAVFGLDCGAPILGPISVHGVPFWGRFWCVAHRFWARFWCTVPILGRISLHGAPFWVRFWRVAFLGSILGSILVRGALMLGSITASGQQDLSKHEHFAFWRFVGHLLVDLKTS